MYYYYKQLRRLTINAIRAGIRSYSNQEFENCSSKEKCAKLWKSNILKNINGPILSHIINVNDLNVFFIQIPQRHNPPKADLLNFYKNYVFHNDIFHVWQTDEESFSKITLNIETEAF